MHSYGATLKNNKTESEAVTFLLAQNPRLKHPTKEERKEILKMLGLPATYARTYDLVLVPDGHVGNVLAVSPTQLILVELKTTRKRLPELPKGFFFGATENEFELAEQLGDKYMFCFVSLHVESSAYVLMTLKQVNDVIRTKRVQYQINL